MDKETWQAVDRLAARAVAAAETIDAIRGGKKAWRWLWEQIERLYETDRHNDPDAIRPVAEALENRLEAERERTQEEGVA